ncbi:hypothetical protein KEM54_006907 [Ascosphaera aggregata]|nr:hypothetical protein KEM54_006907 [Ascosphaera aggregata]
MFASSFLRRCSQTTTRSSLLAAKTARIQARLVSTLPNTPIFRALKSHDPTSTAIEHHGSPVKFSYGSLISHVVERTEDIRKASKLNVPQDDGVRGQPVAFLAGNGYDYVVNYLAILAADAIALPLQPAFPNPELMYILNQSQANILLATSPFEETARSLVDSGSERDPALLVSELRSSPAVPIAQNDLELVDIGEPKGGMMLYTSGTTNKPKGVLIPQSALSAQAASLMTAWKYSPADRLLHVLPLHHIHGTVNALLTPLLAGSTIEYLYPFDATTWWKRLASPLLPATATQGLEGQSRDKITFFTGVPTHYTMLMSKFLSLDPETQRAAKEGIHPSNLRLNISGSAALPTPTKDAWTKLSNGNVLLERYGMTEVGMAISCGLDPSDRVDGSVGWPLPSVECRLQDTDTGEIILADEEIDPITGRERVGEIQLRGPTIFKEYWRNPTATEKEFIDGGDGKGKWFKTGDVAVRRTAPEGAGEGKSGEWAKGKMYFIQGRTSIDIIKSGGEKVSALEVERELLSLPEIAEAAVVALPNEKFGCIVAAAITLTPEAALAVKRGEMKFGYLTVRNALQGRLAKYKVPKKLKVVDNIPRNAMGKSE